MKNIFTTLIAIGVFAFGTAVNSASFTPAEADWSGDEPNTFHEEDIAGITGFAGTDPDDGSTLLRELFKADFDGLIESGTYDYSYDIVWTGEPNGGTITGTGTEFVDIIECTVCYLYVKDGKNDPSWYLFNISQGTENFWDGIDPLILSGFWEDNGEIVVQGSISHVTIFGWESSKGLTPPEVPIPAAAWLFGSGLIGLVGVARRKVTDNNA